jgi:hypothetical protein
VSDLAGPFSPCTNRPFGPLAFDEQLTRVSPHSYLNLSATRVVFMSGEVVGAADDLVPSYDG